MTSNFDPKEDLLEHIWCSACTFAVCAFKCWWSDLPALIDVCYFFLWHDWHSCRCPPFWGCLFPVFFPVFLSYFSFSFTFLSLWCLTSSISVGSSWHFSFSPSLFLPVKRKCSALPRACVCGRGTRAILETEFVCGCTRSNALGVCVCFFISISSRFGGINNTRNHVSLFVGHFMVLNFSPFEGDRKCKRNCSAKLDFRQKNLQIKHSILFPHVNIFNSNSNFLNIHYFYT